MPQEKRWHYLSGLHVLLQVLNTGESHPTRWDTEKVYLDHWDWVTLCAAGGRSNVELVGILNIFQSKKQTKEGNQALILSSINSSAQV